MMGKNDKPKDQPKAPRPGTPEWKRLVDEEIDEFDEANPDWDEKHGGKK